MTPADAARALQQDPLADPAGRLRPGGAAELRAEQTRLADLGRRAFVLVLPPGEAPAGYRPVWEALGLQGPGDLLLVHGEGRWEAKGWGLSGAQISAALDAAEPARDRALGPGLVAALQGLGRAAGLPAEAPAAAEGEGSGALAWVGGAGALGLVALGGLGLLRWRQTRMAAMSGGAAVTEARHAAEARIAAITLRAEALPDGDARDLQARAAALTAQLAEAEADPGGPTKRVARLQQLESEAAALHSSLLAAQRRRP
jgi:hypothetical protein